MDESSTQRHLTQLVEDLVTRHALRSEPVRRAFLAVPRHTFVPGTPVNEAYSADRAIPTHVDGRGVPISSASAPAIMAVMLELLDLAPGQRVLEIGAGTGYNAALLARLVGEAGAVTSLDIDEQVAREASDHLAEVGAGAVAVHCTDGWLGELRSAPFERIIATVECWDISPHWFGQLSEGGVLVLPLALGPGLTMAVAFEKLGQVLTSRSMAYCGFMPLRGPHAGPESRTLVSRWDDTTLGRQVESRWVAAFPDATQERGDILRALLADGVTERCQHLRWLRVGTCVSSSKSPTPSTSLQSVPRHPETRSGSSTPRERAWPWSRATRSPRLVRTRVWNGLPLASRRASPSTC